MALAGAALLTIPLLLTLQFAELSNRPAELLDDALKGSLYPVNLATLAVADKEMPGFGEEMRRISLNFVPTAILSRQVAVIRGETAPDRGTECRPDTGGPPRQK